MNIQDGWERALERTKIIRPRVKPLNTFESTVIPYVFLSKSKMNPGDTVVRKGEVVVRKPSIVLPQNMPQFEGFKFEEELAMDEDLLKSFFLVRGISFPSMKYDNKTFSLDVFEGGLPKAISHFGNLFERMEDTHTGLFTGPEETWPLSVLIFVCGQASKAAESDVKKLFDEAERRGLMS
jgi:hypothetical protein